MSTEDDTNLFTSSEEYYARYRPRYGDAAIRYLKDRFEVDESSRALDLGCGAGQITIPLAAHANVVVGMDPNTEMLRKAQQQAEAVGRDNVEWVVGSDSDLSDDLGPFRLTTMGRSFHWMDQRETLDRLYSLTEPGGGIAILNDADWFTRGGEQWQEDVYALTSEYIEDLPDRIGSTDIEYEDPWDEMIDEFEFTDIEVTVFESEREWDIDSIVGYVFSLSFCSPEIFGTDMEEFEDDLRALLNEREGETFAQNAELKIISGRK
jgi:SAM-dependent methyltransferase